MADERLVPVVEDTPFIEAILAGDRRALVLEHEVGVGEHGGEHLAEIAGNAQLGTIDRHGRFGCGEQDLHARRLSGIRRLEIQGYAGAGMLSGLLDDRRNVVGRILRDRIEGAVQVVEAVAATLEERAEDREQNHQERRDERETDAEFPFVVDHASSSWTS